MESPTATELALPGLEGGTVMSDPSPQHYIVRGPEKRLMVFAGRSHPELAAAIAEKLGVELGDVELETFANDETYCRYLESIRGADVFVVQTGCLPVDKNLMELVLMIQAAKLASAKRITAVIPWFPYSRQDRKAKPREPISARLVADMLQLAGVDRVLTMDLHAGQIQGFFTIPVDHMTALQLFATHFRDLGLTGEGVVAVAPDAGRAKHAVRFAEMIEASFAIMHKMRVATDRVEMTEVTGKVRGKIAIVGDDVSTTGSTLVAGARALKEHGASEVNVFVTHALFSDAALELIAGSEIDRIVVSDSVPVDPRKRPENMTVLSVSGLLAEAIMNVFADDSVSAIFGGENQLFRTQGAPIRRVDEAPLSAGRGSASWRACGTSPGDATTVVGGEWASVLLRPGSARRISKLLYALVTDASHPVGILGVGHGAATSSVGTNHSGFPDRFRPTHRGACAT